MVCPPPVTPSFRIRNTHEKPCGVPSVGWASCPPCRASRLANSERPRACLLDYVSVRSAHRAFDGSGGTPEPAGKMPTLPAAHRSCFRSVGLSNLAKVVNGARRSPRSDGLWPSSPAGARRSSARSGGPLARRTAGSHPSLAPPPVRNLYQFREVQIISGDGMRTFSVNIPPMTVRHCQHLR